MLDRSVQTSVIAAPLLIHEVFPKLTLRHLLDGDGQITLDELSGHMKDAGYADAAVAKIFKSLDLNQDGYLSRDELRAGLSPVACRLSPVAG